MGEHKLFYLLTYLVMVVEGNLISLICSLSADASVLGPWYLTGASYVCRTCTVADAGCCEPPMLMSVIIIQPDAYNNIWKCGHPLSLKPSLPFCPLLSAFGFTLPPPSVPTSFMDDPIAAAVAVVVIVVTAAIAPLNNITTCHLIR